MTISGIVHKYRKRPVECEAMLLASYGDFTRSRDWVNDNGGQAYARPDADKLTLITIDGNIADVHVGWYVVRGVQGEFYPCRADIFEATHECVEPSVKDEARPGSGSSNVPHDSAYSGLPGGMAKKVALGEPSD